MNNEFCYIKIVKGIGAVIEPTEKVKKFIHEHQEELNAFLNYEIAKLEEKLKNSKKTIDNNN